MVFTKNVKDFFSLGLSNLISAIVFGIFWLFLASFLEKIEFGELAFLVGIANIGYVISILGLSHTIMVYEPKKENIFPSSFFVVLISAIITSFVVYLITQNFIISIMVTGLAIFEIILAGLISKRRYKHYSIHMILRSILTVFLALVFYNFFGISGILLAYFLTTLVVLKELPSLIKNKKIEFSLLKSKIKFTLFANANRLSLAFFQWGDKLIIGAIFGFTFLASYYFAAQYLLLLQNIPRSVQQYLLPQEAAGQKNKKLKIFSVIIACFITIISIILIPIGVENFLPQYTDSILPIQIMSVGLIPLTISSIQQTKFFAHENSRLVLFGSILESSLYLTLIIVLGQIYGLVGIAYSFLAAVIIRTVFNQFVEKHFQNESS